MCSWFEAATVAGMHALQRAPHTAAQKSANQQLQNSKQYQVVCTVMLSKQYGFQIPNLTICTCALTQISCWPRPHLPG
jgi:hypothetical protein